MLGLLLVVRFLLELALLTTAWIAAWVLTPAPWGWLSAPLAVAGLWPWGVALVGAWLVDRIGIAVLRARGARDPFAPAA